MFAGGAVSITTKQDLVITGGNILSDSATLSVGGNLTLSSMQNTSTTTGGSWGFNVGISEKGGSVGVNGSTTSGTMNWTVPSSIVTTGILNAYVGSNTSITGAMMNSATGALTLSTNTLVVKDLIDVDKLNTYGGGINVGTNTNNGTTSTNATVNVNISEKDKEGVTRGTIGAGNITVRSLTPAQQAELLATINRDPTKFQQVIIDNWDALRAEIDTSNLAALPDLFKNIGEALKRTEDFLNKNFPNFTDKQKRSFEKALMAGVTPDMIREQCGSQGGFNWYNPVHWLITPAFADGGTCTIENKATGQRFTIDRGDAKDCADAMVAYFKEKGLEVADGGASAAIATCLATPPCALALLTSLYIVYDSVKKTLDDIKNRTKSNSTPVDEVKPGSAQPGDEEKVKSGQKPSYKPTDEEIKEGKKQGIPENAWDHDGPKAPGSPGDLEGFEVPKGGRKLTEVPGGGGKKGWEDKDGNVWGPTGNKGADGGNHWDVIDKNGRKIKDVYPGGHKR